MDPISGAASIVALIEVTGVTIKLIRKLAAKNEHAREEQMQAARRLFDLSSVLGQILAFQNSLGPQDDATLSSRELSSDEHAVAKGVETESSLAHCANQMNALKVLLEELMQQRRFVWVYKSDKVQKRLEEIKVDIDTLKSIFQNSMLRSILDATSKIDGMADGIEALNLRHEYQKMFNWLNAASSSPNYSLARQKRQPKTGDWFLESETFSTWKINPQTLWLHGISGCGKTVLCSTIIEHLKQQFSHNSAIAIVYFFFDFQDSEKQHLNNLLRSILEQLAVVNEDASSILEHLFRECNDGRDQPTNEQLLKACVEATHSFGDIFLIVDALDECQHSEYSELGETLATTQKSINQVHIMTLSQPTSEIREFMHIPAQQQVSIEGRNIDKDIVAYVRDRLHNSRTLRLFPPEQLYEIEVKLTNASGEMFRWVQLQIDELERCENGRELDMQLKTLPSGLPASYEKILSRLNNKQRTKAMHILICLSMSPQTLKILQVENSLQLEPDREIRIASDLRPKPGVVANMLPGLVTCILDNGDSPGKNRDGEMRLAHSSVRDYLFSTAIREGPMKDFAMNSPSGHHYMAKLCVACLLHFNKGPASSQVLQQTCFLSYAANNLSVHARAANDCDNRGTLDGLIVELFESNNAANRNWHYFCDPFTSRRVPGESYPNVVFSGLHHTAKFNLWRVAEALITAGANVHNHNNPGGFPPIHFAAERGSNECIDILVEHGADINGLAWGDKTALHWISEVPHDNGLVAAYLITKGANFEFQAPTVGTPLQHAAYQGRLRIVLSLLHKGANPDAVCNHDRIGSFRFRTALQCAAYGGHVDVVKALIKNGASISQTTVDVGTALHAAAINGKHQTVEALLDLGANIHEQGGRMGSVLTAAYYGGSKDTIRIVLDYLRIKEDNATINKRVQEVGDEKCWNLLEAARRNALGKIQHFVDRGADINARFWFSGETAIIAAASQGHYEAVELLVKKGANLQSRDRTGARAIHVAARRGDSRMIEMLLRSGAEKDIHNDTYETAEDLAEQAGYSHVADVIRDWKSTT